MSFIEASDRVKLYYEKTGDGETVVFVHEFAGDYRSWEPQVRYFARQFQCVTFSARGYPPSDVPQELAQYSQQRAVDDVVSVIRGVSKGVVHLVGLSMGAYTTLHVGLQHPELVRSLVIAGCGYGSSQGVRKEFQKAADDAAERFEKLGMKAASEAYAMSPGRLQYKNKDPRGWQEFVTQMAARDAHGAAMTLRGVQGKRPSVGDLSAELQRLNVPTLIVVGDEDEPCLEPALMLKRKIRTAGLAVVPCSGHAINLEEPGVFNGLLEKFWAAVDADKWLAHGADAGVDPLGVH